MAPRSIWSGLISFGLVNVPVRMYSAIDEHKLQFHFVHEKDDSPIGYQKICKLEEKPVPDNEIVKAYESRKGEYVYMDDEDFAAAEVEGYKTIDIARLRPVRADRPDLLRTHVLPRAARRARRRSTRCSSGDGGVGARRRSRST